MHPTPRAGDYFYGNGQRNVFRGEGGADFLNGWGGNDRLVGWGGNDQLAGGAGDDELVGGDGKDTANFASYSNGPMVADLAAGTADSVWGGGHDLLSGIENLLGSTYDDRLAGNAGANRLEGKEGADVLEGRGGGDRFYYYNRYDSMPTLPDHISTSTARRATRSTWRGSTPTSGRRATRRSSSSARPGSPARASSASSSRTATRSSRPIRTGPAARRCGSCLTRWSRSRTPTSSCSGHPEPHASRLRL